MSAAMNKIDDYWEPTVYLGKLYLHACGDLNRNESKKRECGHIGGADSPGWTVETNITL